MEGCRKFPTKRNTIFYNLKYNTKLVYIYRFARLNVTSNGLLVNGFFYWHIVRQKNVIASLDYISVERFVWCCNLTRDWLISFFNQLQMWPFIQVVKHNLQCLAYHIIIPYLQYRSVASLVCNVMYRHRNPECKFLCPTRSCYIDKVYNRCFFHINDHHQAKYF